MWKALKSITCNIGDVCGMLLFAVACTLFVMAGFLAAVAQWLVKRGE